MLPGILADHLRFARRRIIQPAAQTAGAIAAYDARRSRLKYPPEGAIATPMIERRAGPLVLREPR
jgi:hypothetical protein